MHLGRSGHRAEVLARNTLLHELQHYCPRGAQRGRKSLTIVFNDFGLLLVVILLDTVDLYRYLRINDGVFAFVHLGQLLTRDDLWRKQRKRSGHH